jgi:hypothetical protein
MIFGAGTQNANLKKAATKRVDPTPKAQAVSKLSGKISSSQKTSSTPSPTIQQASKTSRSSGPSDPVRGSFEGLDKSAGTLILPKGAGYDSKSFQTARYKEKNNFKPLNYGSNNFASFKKSGKITRYGSSVAQNSSANKLGAKLTVEKMFR